MLLSLNLVVRADNGLVSGMDEIPDSVNGRSVKVSAILSMFDELSGLDVDLHLLAAFEEVVLAVDLAWTARSRCVCK